MKKVLHTKRLTLRPLTVYDLTAVHEYSSDLETTKLMMFLPNETLDETKEFLINAANEWEKETPTYYEFGMIYKENLIGAISVYLDETMTEGELGWIINKAYWKQGFTKEAALTIKDFCIHELKLKRILAHCDSQNIGSYRVMEAIGLTKISDDQYRCNKSSKTPSLEFCYELRINEEIS